MRIFRSLFLLSIVLLNFTSCQKEFKLDTGGVSVGSLKKDATGNCLPPTVGGIFQVDSVLNNDNYVEVMINVSNEGTFDIRSDTVNGYSFSKTASIGKGTFTIRLFASGKPIATGTNTFTVRYNTSVCTFNVSVIGAGAGGTAVYSLGSSPGACTSFTPNGAYTAGTALGAANNVTLSVNVITIGTYTINTTTADGINFTASGTFTNTGIKIVTLTGTGTPATAGNFNFTVSGGGSSCTFGITVSGTGGGGGGAAVYTLGGSPGNCTGVILNGTYMAGVATGASNTAKVDVNVATAGTYSLTTTTLNGIKFSASGIFAIIGPQTVTLIANTATPAGPGTFNYPITGAGTNCSFPVTFTPAAPPAVFTLSGAPGTCSPANVNGTYTVGTTLNASNNVVMEVNVGTIGSYTLSTNTVNGMKFTATGIFTVTGLQNVTLLPTAGSNPVAPGTSTLTPQFGTSSCTFDIPVTGPSDLVYSFKIGATTYSGPCSAILIDLGGGSELMNIYDAGSTNSMDLDLENPTGPVTGGLYSGTSSTGKNATFTYNTSQFFSIPGSGLTNLSATITSINTVTRIVQGTFSGTVINLSAATFTITNGTFKADY